MGKFILWIVMAAGLGYGGWYWYSIQPKSFTEIIKQTESNQGARYPEDVCETPLREARASSPTLVCEITDARRVDGDITDVDIQCKGRNSALGCFICTIACK